MKYSFVGPFLGCLTIMLATDAALAAAEAPAPVPVQQGLAETSLKGALPAASTASSGTATTRTAAAGSRAKRVRQPAGASAEPIPMFWMAHQTRWPDPDL